MKFVSFLQKSQAKFGISDGKNITDLTGKINGANTLKELISNKGIEEAKQYIKKNPGDISLDKIEYLPVIPNPGKIICVGLNYSEHVKKKQVVQLNKIQLFFLEFQKVKLRINNLFKNQKYQKV